MKVTVDLDIEEIVDESRYNENTFKEEFTDTLKYAVVNTQKEQCTNAVIAQIQKPVAEQVQGIAEGIAREILESDLKTRKFQFRINYNSTEATIGELIENVIQDYTRNQIVKIVEEQAKGLVNEMRKRYDMTFAALIVDNMRQQKLLADDRLAELLNSSNNS